MSPYEILLVFLAGTLVLVFGAFFMLAKWVRKGVEDALKDSAGDDKKQAEIRKAVVKAVFPPRFPRD